MVVAVEFVVQNIDLTINDNESNAVMVQAWVRGLCKQLIVEQYPAIINGERSEFSEEVAKSSRDSIGCCSFGIIVCCNSRRFMVQVQITIIESAK